MKQRLSQVAAFAGVSEATVRRVLNGAPDVMPKTRDAVLTALDVHGFERPARFRRGRAPLVGLVIPELLNPVFPAFVQALSGLLSTHGLVPALCNRAPDGGPDAHSINLLLGQRVAGLVFVGASYTDIGEEQGRRLREERIPLVLINAADENLDLAQVNVDDALAAEQAMAHLTSLGHRRIGLVLGPVGHVPSALKLRGYAAFQARRGLGSDDWRPWVAHTIFSMEGGSTALPRLVDAGVTAVVCASDALALGAIRAARRRGLRVPDDLSVVGFDDSPFLVATDPPLTTARQPVATMAAAAVASLVSQLGGHAAANELMLFEPELVVRSSTAPPPAG
ncbi:LacI family DNA-binding transcriptional regulator [Streptomyces triticirhizae]|uniref:LacI family DNA-binding transcriptional regulator n=1 Tax=Streptomyces triticirhizae TaxID=2483353 RepID=A0A3M2M6Z8_9ACTN|nr:LacI family DNA-binding transcriptional regulator [Streptomyces triticirhizae]RMI44623.1 LacI family DNA-binding transcriptional regulator [Streptomyces triticirhizae]